MNQNTKQRIVGTVVLLALALIFLPLVFDGEGSYQQPVSSRIPPAPIITPVAEPIAERVLLEPESPPTVNPDAAITDAVTEPTSDDSVTSAATDPAGQTIPLAESPAIEPGIIEPSLADAGIVEPEIEQPSVQTETPVRAPTLDEQGLPVGWSVRLGSFSDAANADALLQRLLQANYKAYSRQITTDQGVMTAIYVGPQLERERIEALRQQLQQEFQLSGMVVRFEIEAL